MTRHLNPALKVALSASAVMLASTSISLANTGRIEFVNGNVALQGANGASKPIARGTEVSSGDTLRTNAGLVQIRYSDGAIVSLRPDTDYTIEEYRFSGKTDGDERALFKLLKGTMRTVTGLVGRINKDRYVLNTPSATIGIRGTGGVVQVDPATGATLLFGTSGTWDLRSPTGPSIPVGAGQTGRTTVTQPAETVSIQPQPQPATAPVATQQPETAFSSAENRTTTGQSVATGASVGAGGSGAIMNFVGTVGNQGIAFTDVSVTRAGSYDVKVTSAAGVLSKVELTHISGGGQNAVTTVVSGALAEGGTAGDYTWGRMINANVSQVYSTANGPQTDTRLIGPNGGFYYAAGPATQDMPKTGNFTYNLIAGAQARPSFRSEAPITASLNSGQLTGQFTAQGGFLFASLGLTVNNQVMSTSASGPINSNGFNVSGITTGGLCLTSCTTTVQGAFGGSGAANAAAGYLIFVPNDVIGGLAIFQKQ
jgi:hypothetical protein